MSVPPLIRLNPNPEVRILPIGESRFCAVVDDFLANPQVLVDHACACRDAFLTPERGYPGLMLPMQAASMDQIYRFFRRRMAKRFGFLRANARLSSALSMTTLAPAALSNFQRLCHTDPGGIPGRRSLAALVYLFHDESLGGTAFYRWKQPAIVRRALELELEDPAAATLFLADRSAVFRSPPRYMTASNDLAERVTVVPARFNRLVFYSGEIPHSGHITAPQRLSQDFRRGRLTLNCFASVEPTRRSPPFPPRALP